MTNNNINPPGIDYVTGGHTFSLSYQDLKEDYIRFCEMSDEDFVKQILDAMHLCCIICYLKQTPQYLLVSDTGLLHEMIHIASGVEVMQGVEKVRSDFKTILKLS